jgi:protein translocase SecG subunit
MLYWLVATVYILCCSFLILVVLLQQGKGGGMGGAFGGGGGQTVFGGAGAGNALTRAVHVRRSKSRSVSAATRRAWRTQQKAHAAPRLRKRERPKCRFSCLPHPKPHRPQRRSSLRRSRLKPSRPKPSRLKRLRRKKCRRPSLLRRHLHPQSELQAKQDARAIRKGRPLCFPSLCERYEVSSMRSLRSSASRAVVSCSAYVPYP